MTVPQVDTRVFDEVKAVVVGTLGIEDQAAQLHPETGLLGELPELDSLAVVELVVALQQRFDIEIADDEIVGEVFESFGSLAAFVAERTR